MDDKKKQMDRNYKKITIDWLIESSWGIAAGINMQQTPDINQHHRTWKTN